MTADTVTATIHENECMGPLDSPYILYIGAKPVGAYHTLPYAIEAAARIWKAEKIVRTAYKTDLTARELMLAWPEYPATHDISYRELERIAGRALDIAGANWIWEHCEWWTDENNAA